VVRDISWYIPDHRFIWEIYTSRVLWSEVLKWYIRLLNITYVCKQHKSFKHIRTYNCTFMWSPITRYSPSTIESSSISSYFFRISTGRYYTYNRIIMWWLNNWCMQCFMYSIFTHISILIKFIIFVWVVMYFLF